MGLQYDKIYSFNAKYWAPYLRLSWIAQTHEEKAHGMIFSTGFKLSNATGRISLYLDGRAELRTNKNCYFLGEGLEIAF